MKSSKIKKFISRLRFHKRKKEENNKKGQRTFLSRWKYDWDYYNDKEKEGLRTMLFLLFGLVFVLSVISVIIWSQLLMNYLVISFGF